MTEEQILEHRGNCISSAFSILSRLRQDPITVEEVITAAEKLNRYVTKGLFPPEPKPLDQDDPLP